MQKEEEKKKKEYVSPQFLVVEIEMEQGIAAGSGSVDTKVTTDPDGDLATGWQSTDDESIGVGY